MFQSHTSSFGELGIQSQYLDCESYLVDDTLAGTVAAVEKLKVIHRVVLAVAIFVVDSFFGKKLATKMFGHDVTVFKHGMLFASHEGWHRDVYVASLFNVATYVAAVEAGKRSFLYELVAAVWGTVFLFCVKSASGFSALRNRFSAVDAGESVSSVGIFSAANSCAFSRTIQRVAFEFSAVFVQIGLLHAKGLAAVFAGEPDNYASRRGDRLVEAECASARQAAKTSFVARKIKERFAAVFASTLDRHGFSPVCGNAGSLAMSVGVVK